MTNRSVVLLAGLMCDHTVWEHQSATLGNLAEVRTIHFAGFDSIDRMAQAALDQAPPHFALAGHSMGGRVALEVLRRAPERVEALALLDSGYRALPSDETGDHERATRRHLLEKARTEGMRAMALEWIGDMVHPDRLHDRELIEPMLEMLARRTVDEFAAQIRALLERPDATALLPQVRCRTLLLCGREDQWATVARHREMAALMPQSTLAVIPNCGHMSTMERPEAVTHALSEWLLPVEIAV